MSWPLWLVLALVYLAGLFGLGRRRWRLARYIWGAFGLAFLLIHLALLLGWHTALAAAEAGHLQSILALAGIEIQRVETAAILVPDATGWSGLRIGIESSALIEMTVFLGLLLFYPQLPLSSRGRHLIIGLAGTYALNLLRLLVIVGMILIWGKPAVPLAHYVVGRLVFFGGVVILYWYLLTKPTLRIVHELIESSGRAAR